MKVGLEISPSVVNSLMTIADFFFKCIVLSAIRS